MGIMRHGIGATPRFPKPVTFSQTIRFANNKLQIFFGFLPFCKDASFPNTILDKSSSKSKSPLNNLELSESSLLIGHSVYFNLRNVNLANLEIYPATGHPSALSACSNNTHCFLCLKFSGWRLGIANATYFHAPDPLLYRVPHQKFSFSFQAHFQRLLILKNVKLVKRPRILPTFYL